MWEFYFYSALYRTQANENNSFAFWFICFPEYSTLMIFEINRFPFSALLGLVLLCSPLKGNHPKMDRCSHWHPPDSLVRWWELLYSLILVATVLSSEKKGMTKIPLHERLLLPAGLLLADGTNYNSVLKQWRGWHAKLLIWRPSFVARFPWVKRGETAPYFLPTCCPFRFPSDEEKP